MRTKILPILSAIILAGCATGKAPQDQKPVISVSILPQQYLVEQLAGDLVEVNVMVAPGASPATYEPTFRQMVSLEHSSLYFKAGYLGFEMSWMDRIIDRNQKMRVIDLSSGIELIETDHVHHEGHEHNHIHTGTDPHIWMSVRNMKTMASTVADALYDLLPVDTPLIKENLENFHLLCESLDKEIGAMLAGTEPAAFLIYHPALGYFARDYGLEQVSLEFEGKAPSPSQVRKLADKGRELEIQTIFIQKQFDQENAKVLAKEIGAGVVQIDPLDPDWESQILHIARMIKNNPS